MPRSLTMDLAKQYEATVYHWSRRGGDWRIGQGPSNFLLAEGSGWSVDLGKALYESLAGKPADG